MTNERRPSAAIQVEQIEKRYGPRRAVDGLSFDVQAGEIFGLLGPNGAGKTTTVEILEGYRQVDAGTVRVLGLDPWHEGGALRPRIGVMLQEGGLYPGLRAGELLKLFAAYYAQPLDPGELLERVGLTDSARTLVRRLSGGQRQRLSLACAIIGRPDVVFLDEPTAGMDPHARVATWEIVRSLATNGTTVVLTTHAMDEAEELCGRIAIVMAGRLAAIGTPHELTTRGEVEQVEFSAAPGLPTTDLAAALRVPVEAVREPKPGEYLVQQAASPELIATLALWLRDRDVTVRSLRAGRQSLGEVFLALTAEQDPADAPEPETARSRRRGPKAGAR